MMSLEALIIECTPLVRSMARKYIGKYSGWFKDPDQEAEDLAQTGMLCLVEIYPRIDFQETYMAYIFQSVWGAMYNYLDKNIPQFVTRHEFTKTVSLDEALHISDERNNEPCQFEMLVQRHQLFNLVRRFMRCISCIDQFILVANIVDRKSHTVIGKEIGKERKYVAKRLKDSLEKLQNMLNEESEFYIEINDIKDYLRAIDFHI